MSSGMFKRLVALCFAAAVVFAVSAAPASAAYSLTTCKGGAMAGSGATFQTNAQTEWPADFNAPYCTLLFGVAVGPTVSYNSPGSGTGRTRLLNREFDTTSSAATDEAPGKGTTGNATVRGVE